MVSENDLTPWHIYLVMKGGILYRELYAISIGDNEYLFYDDGRDDHEELEVSDIANSLLREDEVLNDTHNLIGIGLDSDKDDVHDATLALHRCWSKFHIPALIGNA